MLFEIKICIRSMLNSLSFVLCCTQRTVEHDTTLCRALSPSQGCFATHCLPLETALPPRANQIPIEFVIAFAFSFFSVFSKSLMPHKDQWLYLNLPPLKENVVQCLFKVFFFIIDKLISKYFHYCIRSICSWKGNCH